MPIYKYFCEDCHKEIEILVFSADDVQCPICGGKKLTKGVTAFNMYSGEKSSDSSSGCSTCNQNTCSTCNR